MNRLYTEIKEIEEKKDYYEYNGKYLYDYNDFSSYIVETKEFLKEYEKIDKNKINEKELYLLIDDIIYEISKKYKKTKLIKYKKKFAYTIINGEKCYFED